MTLLNLKRKQKKKQQQLWSWDLWQATNEKHLKKETNDNHDCVFHIWLYSCMTVYQMTSISCVALPLTELSACWTRTCLGLLGSHGDCRVAMDTMASCHSLPPLFSSPLILLPCFTPFNWLVRYWRQFLMQHQKLCFYICNLSSCPVCHLHLSSRT